MNKHFYVTTPIYYVTAKPHLGSLYSTLIADVISRWQKLKGSEVFFLTGTDEYGQKIAQAAEQAGISPEKYVLPYVDSYKKIWKLYDIDYTQFIRTTDPTHVKAVQAFIKQLQNNGAVYKDAYKGWYCTPCETFIPEKEAQEHNQSCPSCGREIKWVEEEAYFFKLSAYQDMLLQFYRENPDFVTPRERMHELISFVQSGLKDLCISRSTIKWGVPFPGDPSQVVYVWVDALCNYISALGYGDPKKEDKVNQWWPAQVQVIGKDIIRFHGIYWPALLMAADMSPPEQLLVHGWIKIDNRKMSKSLGNVIDPEDLAQEYGSEQVRYYLMRQLAITQDSSFSSVELEQRITSDLAHDLGNLLQRMVSLGAKYDAWQLAAPESWSPEARSLRDESLNVIDAYQAYIEDYEFHMALSTLWRFINKVNAYFHEQEPWKLVKKDETAFHEVLSATAHALRTIAYLLWPVMPKKMEELLSRLGITFELENNTIESLELARSHQSFLLKEGAALFAIHEPKKNTVEEIEISSEPAYCTIDDVMKVELRVGTITSCEPMPKSEKLYKMSVDFGDLGVRQILAGVQKYYTPEELINKQGIFVYNLKPRKMMGTESQGMMLLAKTDDDKLVMAAVADKVPNGTRLQ